MKIQYEFEDNVWYSYSDELPGCYGEGATKEEAKESFMKGYQLYKEVAHERGIKIGKINKGGDTVIYKPLNVYLLKHEVNNYSATYQITHYSAKQALRMAIKQMPEERMENFTFTKLSTGTKKYNIILSFFKQIFTGRPK